jgi:hypothetical protein
MSAPETKPEPAEAQQPAAPPPKKKKTGLIIGVVLVVVILVVVIVAVVFIMGQSPLVGKWNIKHVTANGKTIDVSANLTATFEFKSNGDFVWVNPAISGSGPITAQWKDIGGGKVTLTVAGASIDCPYTVSGNKLTITITTTTYACEKA